MTAPIVSLEEIAEAIALRCARGECPLVALSGIDGSGKSTLAPVLVRALAERSIVAALIGLDPWHTAPEVRFDPRAPAETFYRQAYRFEELFARLLEPLRRERSLVLELELRRAATHEMYRHRYRFEGVQAIVVEGIFLLRSELRGRYDLAYWVDCPFEVALARALRRNQEGLSEADLIREYETTYFPAQRLHLERDDPLSSADGVFDNGLAYGGG